MNNILVIVCLCITVLTGCTKNETTPPKDKSPKDKSPTEKTLLIGLIPERNIFEQLERYEPLTDYLSEKLEVRIKLRVLTRYGNIIDNFISSGMDGAFFGSFTYAVAHATLGVEAIARPETNDGISKYHGIIFVRKDSGIKTAEDMKGKTFAFVDKATTAGYVFPLAYFKEKGIQGFNTYFKETYFAGTHEDAITDVLNKKADIGASKNTIFSDLAKSNKRIAEELIILKRSPEVPQNSLAVRMNIDSSVKNKLKETLLNMHNDAYGAEILKKFGAKRFINTNDSDYVDVYKYLDEAYLNLNTYDYINK